MVVVMTRCLPLLALCPLPAPQLLLRSVFWVRCMMPAAQGEPFAGLAKPAATTVRVLAAFVLMICLSAEAFLAAGLKSDQVKTG
jgi:hypothetical protein